MENNKSDYRNIIKEIKKDFYAFRNGIVSESLRKLYSPGKMIYGLTVPQFMEIAKKYPKDMELAIKLWGDKKCRESRLFSLYILPYEQLNKENASQMIKDVESSEEAEFLAFKILRQLPFALELYEELAAESITEPMPAYCMEMFKKNLNQI